MSTLLSVSRYPNNSINIIEVNKLGNQKINKFDCRLIAESFLAHETSFLNAAVLFLAKFGSKNKSLEALSFAFAINFFFLSH